MKSTQRPEAVRFWVAKSSTRDFRKSRWTSQPGTAGQEGSYTYQLPIPSSGYAAVFGEAEYNGRSMPYFLSSNVRIVPQKLDPPAQESASTEDEP